MLNCDQALELISAKVDNALTAEESAALEEHLAACAACRALLADFEALHQAMPQLAAQPPAELKNNIMQAVRQSKVTPFQGKKTQWRWRSLASLAAVLVLVVVGGSAMRQWEGAASRTEQAAGAIVSDTSQGETAGDTAPAPAVLDPEVQAVDGEKAGRSLEEYNTSVTPADIAEEKNETVTPPATPAPTQESALPTVLPEEQVNPTGLTISPNSVGLTQDEALKKLALYLGWAEDSLTADNSGVLTGPSDDGVKRTITCTGLNEAGTGWVCQVEETAPGGPDASVSRTTYTVPLDGSEITQP